jgi:hypothetical protein
MHTKRETGSSPATAPKRRRARKGHSYCTTYDAGERHLDCTLHVVMVTLNFLPRDPHSVSESQNSFGMYQRPSINSLTWGAKSWNLSKQNLKKLLLLHTFHHSVMRWKLGRNMERVRNKKISIRKAFCNLPTIYYYVKGRVKPHIGKIIRQDQDLQPKKLMGTWIKHPRKLGQPRKSCRNLAVSALSMMLPELRKH